jgi:hypothetical protein
LFQLVAEVGLILAYDMRSDTFFDIILRKYADSVSTDKALLE